MKSNIDYTNLDVAMEVLADVVRDFPIPERVNDYKDEILKIVSQKVHRTCKNLQEKYNEQADRSIDEWSKYQEQPTAEDIMREELS